MKKSFTKVLMLVLAVISVGVLGSCKDYEEDKYNDLQHQIADQNKTLTDALASQKAYLEGLIAQIKQCDCDKSIVEKAVQDIEDLKARLTAAEGNIGTIENLVSTIVSEITDINTTLLKLDADLKAQGVEIDGIKENIELWTERITDVEAAAAEALAQAEANAAAIEELEANAATKEEVAAVLAEAQALYADAIKYADDLAEGLAEDIANNKAAIAALQGTIDQMGVDINNLYFSTDLLWMISDIYGQEINNLNEEVDSLKTVTFNLEFAVSQLQDMDEIELNWLNDLEERVAALEERLDAIEEDLYTKMVTGVVLQGTKNPVFGSVNLPLGVTSNVLVAYYGTATQAGQFPFAGTAGDGRFVKRSDDLTAEEAALLGEKLMITGTLISADAANAGKLYATVNPNTVDFTGKKLQLVNSKDEESAMTLAALEACDEELTFGYSRADNGLYVAKAQVTEDAIEALKFPTEGWIETVKQAYNDAKAGNRKVAVSELVLGLYNQMDGVLPALAAKATWTDKDGNDHSVYSNYNVAATAIKPLSFSFMQDKQFQNVPGYKKALNVVNKLAKNITNKLNDALAGLTNIGTVDPITIGGIAAPSVDVIEVTVDLPIIYIDGPVYYTDETGLWFIDQNTGNNILVYAGNVTLNENNEAVIRLAQEDVDINPQIAEIFNAINDALAATNNDLAQVVNQINQIIAEINSLEGKINDAVGDIKSEIVKYMEKINGKLVQAMNGANKALMPVLVVNTEKGAKLGSHASEYPTVASKNVTIIPTSYTAELLAPAYKKIVACTKAWNADGTENASAAAAFNALENTKTLLDGGNAVKINATLEQGVKYEITYAAVDYSGMIAVRKSYIECK